MKKVVTMMVLAFALLVSASAYAAGTQVYDPGYIVKPQVYDPGH